MLPGLLQLVLASRSANMGEKISNIANIVPVGAGVLRNSIFKKSQ